MFILKRVAPAVYCLPPTMWGVIPGRSPLEAIFLQDAVLDMDPISLVITSLDVKGPSPTPRTASYGPSGSTWDSPSRASCKRTSPPACTP